MKTPRCLSVLLIITTFLTSCNSDPGSDMTGLVSFASNPTYNNDAITFTAQIQFGFAGQAIEIEYKIMSAESEVYNSSAIADNNPDGMGLWFETDPVSYSLPASEYSGQTITVWLDPDNKITSKDYTSESAVNTWKKETITIP